MKSKESMHISRFHYITQDIEGCTHACLAEQACKGGAEWIQLRVKGRVLKAWKEIALQVKTVCEKYNATLIINDNVQLTKDTLADGVHLGKNDMPVAEARKILGRNFIIGGTANTFEDMQTSIMAGVDYIGLGPFRFTNTKRNLSPVLGTDGIHDIIKMLQATTLPKIPIIAIGGIKTKNIKELFKTGIYGIAVSSAINNSENKTKQTIQFLKVINYGTANNIR